MSAAFPLSPAPSYYTQITPGAAKGVFYAGGTAPFVTLNKTGATGYTVRDYWGNVVSSGSVSGTTVTPAIPSGGWKPGWYRLYLTGPSTDSVFGPAYGSSNFVILRSDSRFPAFTPGGTNNLLALLAKGALGMGTSRLQIDNANAPTTGTNTIAVAQSQITDSKSVWAVTSGPFYDSARPRLNWLAFPNGTTDSVAVGDLTIYCKDGTIDGSTVTVTVVAGTSSGKKITVNGETYDNLASPAAAVTALLGSSLVRGFNTNGSSNFPTLTATVIGNAYFNGVKQVVSALYPDVTRFEGPSNESAMSAEAAHRMRLFQAAVKAGNASAKAIGPCPVSVAGVGSTLDTFFAAGGGSYCDEISVHAYNGITNGDLNLGRNQLAAFVALLTKYGLQNVPLWQTEATQVMSSVYGVFHPRRSRVPVLQTLLWEQYGVPRERNPVWYDTSHGFWSFPTWWMNGDETLQPYCVLLRVLAEETFGQTHSSALSFGALGDRIFLGSIYAGASTKTVVLLTSSYMPNSTVTLNLSGSPDSLTVVDGFGNTSTVTVQNNQATVPVSEIPTYVRLPAGVNAGVDHVNDWPTSQIGRENLAYGYPISVAAGTVSPSIGPVDGNWQQRYTGSSDCAKGTTVPDTYSVSWPNAARVDRVLIWSGIVWQNESGLVDFDVQTSVDGSTWVTQATVTKTTPSSFQFGADSNGTGCQYETFWDEQYIFDVKLPAPITCKAIRLNVRATSYGGEPDSQAVTAGGQGNSTQYVTLQEIVPVCDNNVIPHYATIN